MKQTCLFCGGDASEPDHWLRCDGQQGRVEELELTFTIPVQAPDFDGETYEPTVDHDRLGAQALRVWSIVRDGQWRTLAEIEALSGDPQASISARLRDFRKPRFGDHVVQRRRRGVAERGLFEYRVYLLDALEPTPA